MSNTLGRPNESCFFIDNPMLSELTPQAMLSVASKPLWKENHAPPLPGGGGVTAVSPNFASPEKSRPPP